jgi:hypothetical protein
MADSEPVAGEIITGGIRNRPQADTAAQAKPDKILGKV